MEATVRRTCKQCGVEFDALAHVVKRGPRWALFCSRPCKHRSQAGNGAPNWKGGRWVDSRGYIKRRFDGRLWAEHIGVVESAMGHRLPPSAVVHHVDGNRANNATGNLVACQNHAYHMLLHARARIVRAGGDPNTQKLCSTCKAMKYRTDFHRYRRYSDGLDTTCKTCRKVADDARWFDKRQEPYGVEMGR